MLLFYIKRYTISLDFQRTPRLYTVAEILALNKRMWEILWFVSLDAKYAQQISIMLKNDVVLIQLCNTLVCQLFFLAPAITATSLAFISQGSFSNDDSGTATRRQKCDRFNSQNNNFARASHLFVHFSVGTARLRRENAKFYVLWKVGHFTVVCSVPWPLNRSEAAGDLVLLQTFLFFMCKSWYSHANKPVNTWSFTYEKQQGL